jgi:hypothetical protein
MKPIADMIRLVEDSQTQDKLFSIYETYEDLLVTLPGSLRHHHVYVQGLYDHIQQTMHLALKIFNNLRAMGPIGCSQDDVILVSFLSSIDRVERLKTEVQNETTVFLDRSELMSSPRMMIAQIAARFGVTLEERHLHALTFMTGRWQEEEFEYVGDTVNISPLATILRAAKTLSINCFPFNTSIVEEQL